MIDERINFEISMEGESNHEYKDQVSNKTLSFCNHNNKMFII